MSKRIVAVVVLSFRIDFDVDGTDNRVLEEETHPAPSAAGNAFAAEETPLTTEQYPVMSTDTVGFRIVPHGVFDANPALDVPGQG